MGAHLKAKDPYVENLEKQNADYEARLIRIEDLMRGWQNWDPNHEVKIGSVLHDLEMAESGADGVSEVDQGE